MNRRDFLKLLPTTALGVSAGVHSLAWAGSGAGRVNPVLVSVFLRGGMDGLHLVGPAADADYQASRPPELRVLDSGDKPGILLERSLSPSAGFRLHPEAAALGTLYHSGRMAIVHGVGMKDGTRSHFVAQDLMERGLPDAKRISQTNEGWVTRALSSAPSAAPRGDRVLVPAYSATSATAFALHGLPTALTTPDLANGLGLPWGQPSVSLLQGLADSGQSAAHQATRRALQVLTSVDRNLPRDDKGKVLPYRSEVGNYDPAGDLGRALSSVARLIRMDAGLVAACVDHGGWDTHENQPGRFANQVRQLSAGLAAFHDDMAAAGRPVVVVVMTEFGRRVRANKSNGTDHGHGACWLVLGDGVRGGRMFGEWPGLSTAKMDQGVDLAVTTDYRQVLSEATSACQLASREAFPEWSSKKPLGLFG